MPRFEPLVAATLIADEFGRCLSNARRARPGSIKRIRRFHPEDFGRKMRVLSATTCKRLRQLHERLHRIKVADCFLTDCPIKREALEQALDRNLEFLPIQGVRNLGNGEYFIRNVPW